MDAVFDWTSLNNFGDRQARGTLQGWGLDEFQVTAGYPDGEAGCEVPRSGNRQLSIVVSRSLCRDSRQSQHGLNIL